MAKEDLVVSSSLTILRGAEGEVVDWDMQDNRVQYRIRWDTGWHTWAYPEELLAPLALGEHP